MKKISLFAFVSLVFIWTLAAQEIRSPNNNLQLTFSLLQDGTPAYALTYKSKAVVKTSKLGFVLKNDKKSLLNDFVVADVRCIHKNFQQVNR